MIIILLYIDVEIERLVSCVFQRLIDGLQSETILVFRGEQEEEGINAIPEVTRCSREEFPRDDVPLMHRRLNFSPGQRRGD